MALSRPAVPLLLWVAVVVTAAGSADAAQAVPYGHRDFYPSPERPLGFRGDGNGHFPGATPVGRWWEGTPHEVDMRVGGPHREPTRVWAYADRRATNIVWKTPLPGWSSAQPLPVGDRVICICEPDWILCVDAHTGKVLWQDQVAPMLLDGLPEAEGRRRQEVVDIARASLRLHPFLHQRGDVTQRQASARQVLQLARPLERRMREIESDPEILEPFARYRGALDAMATRTNAPKRYPGPADLPAGPVSRKYSVVTDAYWIGDVGLAVCTPVTDGRHVWAVFGQGQVVCYDLLGRRVWGTRQRDVPRKGKIMAGHWPAPLLYRDTLIVRGLDGESVLGLDAATGKTRWQREFDAKAHTHGAYATHKIMAVSRGDGRPPLHALVTAKGLILAPATGDELGRWTYAFRGVGSSTDGHGLSVIGQDNMFFWAKGAEGYLSLYCRAYRMTVTNDNRIAAEPLFTMSNPHGKNPLDGVFGYGPVALTREGIICNGAWTWDARTGKLLGEVRSPRLWNSYGLHRGRNVKDLTSAVVAGDRAIFTRRIPGNYPRRRLREDGAATTPFFVVDIRDPRKPRMVADNNLLGGPELPRDRIIDTYFPDVDKKRFVGAPAGVAPWFGCRNGGVMPMGNRLFIQSATHLYCIGDPRVAYDWNPESRPQVAGETEGRGERQR